MPSEAPIEFQMPNGTLIQVREEHEVDNLDDNEVVFWAECEGIYEKNDLEEALMSGETASLREDMKARL